MIDPNIATNPLPGHGKHAINAIMDMKEQSIIKSAEDIQTPLEVIHAELCKCGIIGMGCVQKGVCTNVSCVGACEAFKVVLQDLMDRHIIQVGIQGREEDVLTLQSKGGRDVQRPIEVPYSRNLAVARPKTIVIEVKSSSYS